MTNETLIVAQAEAFTILRDLMHLQADDPRPQRIINTIKQAALAILRLKPLSNETSKASPARRPAPGEDAPQQASARHVPAAPDAAEAVDTLTEPQFDELIARLPHNTLYPRTDKQRERLTRHFAANHLPCTDDIKQAIVNRASRRSSRSDTAPQAPPHAAPRRAA